MWLISATYAARKCRLEAIGSILPGGGQRQPDAECQFPAKTVREGALHVSPLVVSSAREANWRGRWTDIADRLQNPARRAEAAAAFEAAAAVAAPTARS
jgi:hypothetical protein